MVVCDYAFAGGGRDDDGAKLFGIVSWCAYFITVCWRLITPPAQGGDDAGVNDEGKSNTNGAASGEIVAAKVAP